MPDSTASITTNNASRYLQQLCKHWSHRFTVEFSPESGMVDFGEAQTLKLSASSTELHTDLESGSANELADLEQVTESHLRRFAFREELVFEWFRRD